MRTRLSAPGLLSIAHQNDSLVAACMQLLCDQSSDAHALACAPGLLSIAYQNGGPVSAVWGWVAVSFTNLLVALSMAEIVSAYPHRRRPLLLVRPRTA